MEARLYDALAARAFCDAGRFVLFGFKLKPFSLLHSVQLDALKSPLWAGGEEPDAADFIVAAQICASEEPVIEFDTAQMMDMPIEAARLVWSDYVRVCASRPMLKQRTKETLGDTLKSPLELLIVTYLARVCRITYDEAWRMPIGLAHWYLESAREQEDGDSWILTEEEEAELERLNSAAGKAEAEARDAQARRITEVIAAAARDISTQDERRKLSAAMETLLAKCARGELPEDWEATTWQT